MIISGIIKAAIENGSIPLINGITIDLKTKHLCSVYNSTLTYPKTISSIEDLNKRREDDMSQQKSKESAERKARQERVKKLKDDKFAKLTN